MATSTLYPYQIEQILRADYQKGRPIRVDVVDRAAEREAEMVRKMAEFRSAFNPTARNTKWA